MDTARETNGEAASSPVPFSTGRTRSPTRDDTKTGIENRRSQQSPSVLNGHCHTEISRSEVHAAANQRYKVAGSVTLSVKALQDNQNINGAGNTTDNLNDHSAALILEHQSNVNVHSLAPRDQGLPAAFNVPFQHEDAKMQQNFGPNQLDNNLGSDATGGREPNVNVAHQPTLAQGDALGSPEQQAQAVRPPFGAISEAQSRPRSRRSERPKPPSRPVSSHDLKGADSVMPHSNHATKVKKSNKLNKQNVSVDRTKSPEQRLPTPIRLIMELQRQSGNGIVENYMYQETLIKSQQAQLEEQVAHIKSQELEIETQENRFTSQGEELTEVKRQFKALQEKNNVACEKLKQQGIKYAKHANEVVKAQRFLRAQGEKLLDASTETLKIYTEREANEEKLGRVTEKLEHALRESKEFRLAAQKLETGRSMDDLLSFVTDNAQY